MDLFANVVLGFQAALTPMNLLYCGLGVFVGTLIGVLPGLGPVATMAMLLPATFALPPVSALIMLAGIYYGAQYGGSTTAILVNLPGETSSVVTALDGHLMAKTGRAGVALTTAAVGSFVAGTLATAVIALAAPPLANVALKFGPAEYFSLMVLGLVASVVLAHGSLLKAVGMILLGLLLGLVGTDVTSGTQRYTFGVPELFDGIGFVALAMGLFGLGEIIVNLEREAGGAVIVNRIASLWPTRDDWKRMVAPIFRGTVLGSFLGILPAAAPCSRRSPRTRWRRRSPATPGSSATAPSKAWPVPSRPTTPVRRRRSSQCSPSIPSNPVMALMVGAMIIQGIQPGPSVMSEQPALFWGVVASMWIGTLILVVLNLPMIGLWVRLVTVPYRLLYPAILVFCGIGVQPEQHRVRRLRMAVFGLLGYVFAKLECEPAPMLLGFILGPMMEEYLRRAMLLSRGDALVLLQRPISAAILALAAVARCWSW